MIPAQTEPFVPLTVAAARPGDSSGNRINVVTKPGETQFFKPLTTETSSAASHSASHANKTCDPKVSIQREGDHVTGIRIHCSCGQVIDLACIY